ncbi:MAG: metallo-mystery pair system four-Cys motif protein [Alphaproteobacteria bacterium]|nr:metallo-mystery pair system four-Cys motif protein [Alphaproteobacteria bacterium]MCB9694542.1 metallo-mystery pair system four-Cys motif protein [Alphaproteobacteria bacterium]
MTRSTAPVWLSLLVACGGDAGTDPTDHDHTHETGTTDTAATEETGGDSALDLSFRATVDGLDPVCGQTYALSGGDFTLGDLRFYVSGLALVKDDGTEVPVTLDDDGVWQNAGVALLDFEDGTASCAVGTTEENHSVRGRVAAGTYDGVAFDLGVPFDQNHQEAALAAPPLNTTAMFWSWQGGYKFLRIDGVNASSSPWHVHVGSSMCTSTGPTEAPTVECDHPNRARIVLRGFDPFAGTVVFDAGALLDGTDTSLDPVMPPPGCMSGVTETVECGSLYANLGLDFTTGECTSGCSGQSAFTVE